jgi:hypothetical protein
MYTCTLVVRKIKGQSVPVDAFVCSGQSQKHAWPPRVVCCWYIQWVLKYSVFSSQLSCSGDFRRLFQGKNWHSTSMLASNVLVFFFFGNRSLSEN